MAEFHSKFTATEDVSAALDRAAKAFEGLPREAQKAQQAIAKIIEKNDPAVAQHRALQRQLKLAEDAAAKDVRLVELAAIAKQKVLDAQAARESSLRRRTLVETETNASAASEHILNVDRRLNSLREPIGAVGQMANGLGQAFGTAGTKITSLVQGAIGSFAAGGPLGLAIGGTTALVSELAHRFFESGSEAEKAAEKSKKAAEEQAAKEEALLVKLREKRTLRLSEARGSTPEQDQAASQRESLHSQRTKLRRDLVYAELDQEQRRTYLGAIGRTDETGAAQRAATVESLRSQIKDIDEKLSLLGEVPEPGTVSFEPGVITGSGHSGKSGGSTAPSRVGGSPSEYPDWMVADMKREDERRRRDSLDEITYGTEGPSPWLQMNTGSGVEQNPIALGTMNGLESGLKSEESQKRLERAGDIMAVSMGSGIAHFFKTKDPMDLIGSFVSGAAGVLGTMLGGPGGGFLGGLFGGLFRDGGSALPQARSGLPAGVSYDASLFAWRHPREYMLSAPAVDAMGGISQVHRYNEAARSGRGVENTQPPVVINQNVMAFDVPDVRRVQPRIEVASYERTEYRQGALYRDSLRRSLGERRFH